MPPFNCGLMRESAKNVMTRHSTPIPEMLHAVRIAAPLAPPAAWSPANVNTPPPTMSVMTVVTRRKMPSPPWGWGMPEVADAWCDADSLM